MVHTTAAATPPSGTSPRGWRSLLTGRWHRSSYVLAVLVLLLLAFCNVPGQVVTRVERDEASWEEATVSRFEHGWPLTWAERPNDPWAWYNASMARRPNCWTFWTYASRFHGWALAVNFMAVVAVALLAGGGFELWRRARARRWQLHLRDFFGLVLVISLPGAWYAAARHRLGHENQIVGPPFLTAPFSYSEKRAIRGIRSYSTEPGGCTWMRELFGEQRFQFLDRVAAVQVDASGLAWAAQLPDVRGVEVNGKPTTDELMHLTQLPRLELLDLNWTERSFNRRSSEPSAPEQTVTLPLLPHLRNLSVGGVYCRGLANVPSLTVFNCSGVTLDDPLLRALGGKNNLRTLRLHQCRVERDGLRHLASLPHLTHLELIATGIHDDDLRYLSALTQLLELRLSGSAISGAGMAHLTQLANLRTLELDTPSVGNDGAAHLVSLRNLRTLDIRHTSIARGAIPNLAKMKQVESLSVGPDLFRVQDRSRLVAALPACQIYWPPNSLSDDDIPD